MTADRPETLLRRTVTSAGWRLAAQAVSGVVMFGRSVALARLLPIELFGVFSLSAAVVMVTSVLGTFGLGSALLHRCEETDDEQRAAAVHFTLTLALSSLWLLLLVVATLAFAPPGYRTAVIMIGVTTFVAQMTVTPQVLLTRRVQHRRLALLTFVTAVATTAVGVPLAVGGAGLWALLGIEVVAVTCQVAILYLWRPIFRPRLVYPIRELRYFLSFGLRASLAQLLQRCLNRIDRLWTGLVLGETALGFYSRAVVFAGYPRQLLGVPVDAVIGGSYAELKGDRRRLSEAFLDSNAALLRAAFLIGGGLVAAAPELVGVLLGERWLPMVLAFQFMLLYTLLDPIKTTISHLFVGVGRPEVIVHARVIQLVVAITAVTALGWLFDIAGVAFAIGLVQVSGVVFMLWRSRSWVDVSVRRLVVAPGVAVALAFAAVIGAQRAGLLPQGTLFLGAAKLAVFAAVDVALLIALEPRYLRRLIERTLAGLLPRRTWQEPAD